MKKIKCDVVVVGAGPGGSMAAKTCAKYGLDTVLVEKEEYPSKPNSLTCGVDRRLIDYIKLDKNFVDLALYGIKQYFPDGTEISTCERGFEAGYSLNRKTFDREVLKLALRDRAEYMNKTRAIGLIREDGRIKGIKAKINEKEDIEIRSNIVIGADGVKHKVGKWAGIYDGLEINDLLVVLDSMVENVKIEEPYIYQYLGWKNFPGIFFQIVPHGDNRVGLCAQTFHSFIPKKGQLLDAQNFFIKTHPFFSEARVIEKGGGVFSYHPLKNFTTDGVMLVGDAANQIEKIWGAGILHAMDAGVMAGETAVEAHEEGDFSYDFLSRYEKRYWRLHGKKDMFASYIFKVGLSLTNEYINMIAHLLKENSGVFTDEIFENVIKSPKLTSKLLYELKKEEVDIPDMLSFISFFKQYFRSFWDTFVE